MQFHVERIHGRDENAVHTKLYGGGTIRCLNMNITGPALHGT